MRIGLFLTYGYSLAIWESAGILERELAIYKLHHDNNLKTTVISYGGRKDQELAIKYDWIDIIYNKWGLPTKLFGALLPYLFRHEFMQIDVLKTNQLYGAHVAFKCAQLYHKPLYIRQGYSFFESQSGKFVATDSRVKYAKEYECKYLKVADAIAFSTKEMVAAASKRCDLGLNSISVLPNYVVESNWFPPHSSVCLSGQITRIGYLGKFTHQKNLESLIEACVGLPVQLWLIGDGELGSSLKKLASQLNVKAVFPGRVKQSIACEILRKCKCFVLPSHYEGHPKALIEAMAFGMPVIGTDSLGIRNEIIDGKTGLLVPPTVGGIKSGIEFMLRLSDAERKKMGILARDCVLRKYSLQRIARFDRDIVNQVYSFGSDLKQAGR